jgi:hypothetical protein
LRKRWRAEAKSAIDAHLDRIRGQAEKEGLKEPKEVRRPDHYVWAARFQVGGEHVPSIVESTHVRRRDGYVSNLDERSVRLAIEHLLDQVGIDQRTERPGPKPPKTRRTSHASSHRVAEV